MKRSKNSGITQLELLVSLAIMGMIAVFLANAINFNRQSLDRARFLSDETQTILAYHTLQGWIEDIPLDYAGSIALEFFEGEAQKMRFKSLVTDGSFRQGEISEFVLEISIIDGKRSLVIRGRGQHPLREEEYTISRVLSDSLSRLKIRYYGRRSSGVESQWYDRWYDETYLPDLIKIEWETDNGTPVPPLTLQPGKVERQSTMSLSSLVPPV